MLTWNSRPSGRLKVLLVASAALLAGLAGTASAVASSAPATPAALPRTTVATPPATVATPPATASQVTTPQAAQDAALRTAGEQAKQAGQPVTVDSLTTPTSMTQANPNGTFSTTSTVMPVRVKQNGSWVPVSATLSRSASGWYTPSATPSGIELSAGGTGPLAVLTSPAGGTMSLTFPFRLPAPAISGATATYASVLPGIDLIVTVTAQGGFSDVLEVHDAAAAAELSQLRIATSTTGLSLQADALGNLTATGPGGNLEFTGPAPRMWDSSGQHAAWLGLRMQGGADGLRTQDGAMVLTPDTSMLTASSTRYPVFIDPVVNPASSGTEGYVETQQGCPDYKTWNTPQTNGEGIGYQNNSDYACVGLYRSFYAINTTNLNSSMHVSSATLLTAETYGSDLGCSDTWPVTLKWTGPIGSGTDWANQPGVTSTVQTMDPKTAWCGNQDVNFNVTSVMQDATAGNWANWTFGLYGDESLLGQSSCSPSSEYNCGFMRFADNPSITTVFDIAPNTPTNTTISPAPHDPGGAVDYGCKTSGSYGWVGRTDLGAGNGSDVMLNASLTSNIVGENVRAQWTVWDNSASNNPVGSNVVATPDSAYVPSGTPVSIPVGIALKDGHQYGYRVWAYDGTLLSASAAADCHFNVDLTPPAVPAVTSTSFPPSGTSPGTTLRVGNSGTFSFASTDPVPAGCAGTCMASGVAKFEYSFNTPIPTAGAASVTPGTAVTFTPAEWGTNILYVEAVDNAGNMSQVTQYDFYVPWNPAAKVVPGDVNGDGIPDLLATSTAGNLLLYPGNTDPAITPVIAGTTATSPDGNGWNTFQITHRGSMSQQGIDDLIAHKGGSLYVYYNSGGSSGQFENTANIDPITKPACAPTADNADNCATYDATDWSEVTQILAPGDIYPSTAADPPPSLLTIENGQLWIYEPINGDAFANPVLIGTSGWKQMTLVAPGSVGGQLTLWARDASTGDLYSYPLKLDANGLPVSLGPATGTGSAGTLISGLTLSATTYPTLASPGNLTGSGYPGLYAEDSSGNLWYYPGQAGSSPLSATAQLVGTVDDAAAEWTLTDGNGSTTAADATGNRHTGTLNSGVSWVTGTARGTVASFNGTSGAITTSGPVLSTTGSYSVSGWAYLTSASSWADVATQDGSSVSGFYLQFDPSADRWGMDYRGSNSTAGTVIDALSATAPVLKTWTHLAGTYNASSGQIDLYVNGQLAGTAVDTTPFATSGPFAIGRGFFAGTTDFFPGEISDVEAFGYTLTPAEVTALYQGQLPVNQLS